MKVLKAIISIICTLILSVSLLALSGLLLVRGAINKDTIMNIIMPPAKDETSYVVEGSELAYVNTNEVAYTEEDLNNLDYGQLQSISGDVSKIHEILDSTFVEQGLPTEIIDYIVEDSEYQSTLSTYLDDYLDYSTGNGPKPTIDQSKVNNILNNNIAKYEQETNTKVNTEKVTEMVTKVSEKIDESVDKVADNSNIKPILNLVFSKKLLVGLIVNCAVWAVIIIVLNLNKLMAYYIGAAALLHGIFYVISKPVLNMLVNTDSELQGVIKVVADAIMPKINTYIILSFVVAVISIAIGIVLTVLNKKKTVEETNAN